MIHVHQKNDKQLVNNYRPISLLPIFGKNFEKIIFNRIYNFLMEEELLNPHQSVFGPSDSFVNQLLAITHEIFEAFDYNPPLEVRSVFLVISKAFDRVWHEGLLYKLKSMGISGELYNLLENYFSGRFQRVVLNGQTSSWRPILAGVLQGSILQSVTKIIETHYIFIKKVRKNTLGLVKVTQNAPFPLTQCCTKPEQAMPGSQDQKSVDKLATNIE